MPQQETRQSVRMTGCSRGGTGSTLAQAYHRRGLHVFATARDLSKTHHSELGIETLPIADGGSIQSAVQSVSERTGGTLDVIVNNTGGGYQTPLLDTDLEQARRCACSTSPCGACWPLLADRTSQLPRLMNYRVCQRQAQLTLPGQNATESVLASINDNLRLELRPLGIEKQCYAHTSAYKIPGTSFYAPIAEQLGLDATAQQASKLRHCTVEAYARSVVSNLLSRLPTTTTWTGYMSWPVWAGYRSGWHCVRDKMLEFFWGMNSLRREFVEATSWKESVT